MFPVLQVGPLSIQAPGLFLLIGIWFGLMAAEKATKRTGVNPTEIGNLVFFAGIGTVIGARLIFLLRYPNVFIDRPLNAFSLSPLMLDWEGGILVGALVAFVFIQHRNLSLWKVLDTFTPAFALMITAFGVSRLASGGGYGLPTSLPWGIYLWGAERHPTQIYEAITGLGLFAITMRGVYAKESFPDGAMFLRFAMLSAGVNLFLDSLRADTFLLQNGFHGVQIFSWLVLAICSYLFARKMNNAEHVEYQT